MKKSYTILLVLLSVNIFFTTPRVVAQTSNWLWAKNAGGSGFDEAVAIKTDAAGNTYVAGQFKSSSITFGSVTLTNSGNYDLFLVKYDSFGSAVWAKKVGGTGNEKAFSVAIDNSGYIYVTGDFTSPSLVFGSSTLTNAGSSDILIAKYDVSGNVVWAKNLGGAGVDGGSSVATDNSGNVFVAGYFSSTSIAVGSGTLTNTGSYDMFLVKYDASGSVLWSGNASGAGTEKVGGISIDKHGNCYATGYFAGTSVVFGSTTLTNAGVDNIYLVKYNSTGNVLWAKSAGGSANDVAYSIAVDTLCNAYITGAFNSTTLNIGSTALSNVGSADIFVAKYDSAGNPLWAKRAGGTYPEEANSITIDANGNSYITGYFGSPSISFGSVVLTNASSTGTEDVFVTKYEPSGSVLWAKNTGGSGSDWANAISVDGSGNNLIAGYYANSSTTAIGSFTLNNSGAFDLFVTKLGAGFAGINDVVLQNEILVYPNPSTGIITVQCKPSSENAKLSVYNLLGESVYEKAISSFSNHTIDLSANPNGVYFVSMKTENESSTSKIILQK